MGMIELYSSEFSFVDKTAIKTLIANHVKKAMDERRLTQADVARLIDSSPSTVQRALDRDPTFDGIPGFETVFKICMVLRIPLSRASGCSHQAIERLNPCNGLSAFSRCSCSPSREQRSLLNCKLYLACKRSHLRHPAAEFSLTQWFHVELFARHVSHMWDTLLRIMEI